MTECSSELSFFLSIILLFQYFVYKLNYLNCIILNDDIRKLSSYSCEITFNNNKIKLSMLTNTLHNLHIYKQSNTSDLDAIRFKYIWEIKFILGDTRSFYTRLHCGQQNTKTVFTR